MFGITELLRNTAYMNSLVLTWQHLKCACFNYTELCLMNIMLNVNVNNECLKSSKLEKEKKKTLILHIQCFKTSKLTVVISIMGDLKTLHFVNSIMSHN